MENLGIFHYHFVYFTAIGNILRPLEIFYGHMVYFVVIGTFFPVLVVWTSENLATLIHIATSGADNWTEKGSTLSR
jgi:hypothetical protein